MPIRVLSRLDLAMERWVTSTGREGHSCQCTCAARGTAETAVELMLRDEWQRKKERKKGRGKKWSEIRRRGENGRRRKENKKKIDLLYAQLF
jgi:hypothetical protein